MGDEKIKKILLDSFELLPKSLRDAVTDKELKSKISRVCERNGLESDSISVLEWQTLFVLSGLLHPADFVPTITELLDIPQEKARVTCQEINEEIFRPVKDDLKVIYGIGQGNKPPTPIIAPAPEAPKLSISIPPPAQISTPSDSQKPLNVVLEEKVGVRQTPPPPKPTDSRPLSEVLENALRTTETHDETEPILEPIPAGEPVPAIEVMPTEDEVKKSLSSQPMVVKNFATPTNENEESLNREEILRGIENPSSIKPGMRTELEGPKKWSAPSQDAENFKREPPPSSYKADPYREPFE